jgi:hypothetical protein
MKCSWLHAVVEKHAEQTRAYCSWGGAVTRPQGGYQYSIPCNFFSCHILQGWFAGGRPLRRWHPRFLPLSCCSDHHILKQTLACKGRPYDTFCVYFRAVKFHQPCLFIDHMGGFPTWESRDEFTFASCGTVVVSQLRFRRFMGCVCQGCSAVLWRLKGVCSHGVGLGLGGQPAAACCLILSFHHQTELHTCNSGISVEK